MPLKLMLREKQDKLKLLNRRLEGLNKKVIGEQRGLGKSEIRLLNKLNQDIEKVESEILFLKAEIEVNTCLEKIGFIERDPVCGGRGCLGCNMMGYVIKSKTFYPYLYSIE